MTPNRYAQLLELIPKGEFYKNEGSVLPHRDTDYTFLFTTEEPLTKFLLSDNGQALREVTTDANGEVIITMALGLGEHEIKIASVAGSIFRTYASVRSYAVWLASIAEVVEALDDQIEQVLAGSRLEEAGADYLSNYHGRMVGQEDTLNYARESYRGVLRQLRDAYRWWGSRLAGVHRGVAGLTSAEPLRVPRAWKGIWTLGHDLCPNGNFEAITRVLHGDTNAYGAVNALTIGPTVTLTSAATPFSLANVGSRVRITGAANPTNNGLFTVVDRPSTATIRLTNAAGVVEGAGATWTLEDPPDILSNLNAQAHRYVHRAHAATGINLFPGPIFQPPTAQTLTVTFDLGWDGGDVTAFGTAATGVAVNETFASSVGMRLLGQVAFTTVTSIQKSLVGTTGSVTVGLGVSRAIAIVSVDDHAGAPVLKAFDYRQLAPAVHAAYSGNAANTFPGPITSPTGTSTVVVSFALLWDGGNVIVSGTAAGAIVSETFAASPGATVSGTVLFDVVTGIEKTNVGVSGTTATVGVPTDQELRWSSGPYIPIPASGDYTLTDAPTAADLRPGRAGVEETYDLTAGFASESKWTNYLHINIDSLGWISIRVSATTGTPATASAADIVTDINAALTADVRYGAGYGAVATAVSQATGYAGTYVRIASPLADTVNGSVEIGPGPKGTGQVVFGLPRNVAAVSAGSAAGNMVAVTCTNVARVGLINDPARLSGAAGALTPGASNSATLSDTSGMAVTAADVGRYIRIAAGTAANLGTHQITAVDTNGTGSVTVTHERATAFTAATAVAWSLRAHNSFIAGRIGRGLRTFGAAGTVAGASGATCTFYDAAVAFRLADLGGWVWLPAANDGNHRIIDVNVTTGAGAGSTEVTLLHERGGTGGTFINGAVADWGVWTLGEAIEVVEVDTVGGTATVRAVADTWPAGTFLEAGATPNYKVTGRVGDGSIVARVDRDFLGNATALDNVWTNGANAPDGWRPRNTSAVSYGTRGLLSKQRVFVVGDNISAASLERVCDEVLDVIGRTIRISFWMQQHHDASESFVVEVSWDGTIFVSVTSEAVAGTVFATGSTGHLAPELITGTVQVPWNATTCVVRLRHSVASPEPWSVERCVVTVEDTNGLFLGVGTVSRTPHSSNFGEVLYAWSPEDLSTDENVAMGLPRGQAGDPANRSVMEGHIDRLINVHGTWDRFDVSEYSGGVAANVVGAYSELEWNAALLRYMEVVVGTPGRLSYVQPLRMSAVRGEVLAVTGSPGAAPLVNISNHRGGPEATYPQNPNTWSALDGTALLDPPTRLYSGVAAVVTQTLTFATLVAPLTVEADTAGAATLTQDGIAVAAADWRFSSADRVTILADAFSATAVYVLEYVPADADGIAVVDTATGLPGQPWAFTSASAISIAAAELGASTWTLDYQVDMQAVTDVINLGGSFADYTWFVDSATWLRQESTASSREVVASLQFLANFRAGLAIPSDQDKLTSTLQQDDGTTVTTVPSRNWSYVDNGAVAIDAALFDADSTYTLTYQSRVVDQAPKAVVVLEWRSSATNAPGDFSAPGVAAVPAWTEVAAGTVVNEGHQFHQIRITVHNVSDVRDIRVYGLGLRGIHLRGTANAPGILPP